MEMKWLPTSAPKIVVIFPTKNEEETIENVISNTEKSQHAPQVIVIDAYSSDRTAELAQNAGGKVIQQEAK
jgi:glycosyltransferase involved in cell wall biosynthesis